MLNRLVGHNVAAARSFPVDGRFRRAGLVVSLVALLLWSLIAAFQISGPVAGLAQQDQSIRFDGQGGPFEAVEPLKSADPDFKKLFTSWKELDRIEQGAIAIPSAMPVSGTRFTSGYGVRSDPFRGRAAMHSGVDLAGPVGTKIYATADGVVERSQVVSGYGNLIELTHGHGIETRYGHLSKRLVGEGDRVKRGQLIGLMGSTGRSTGSHLHYEVRINGKAVNPIPFMQSNDYLIALQDRIAARSGKIAMGGPSEGTR